MKTRFGPSRPGWCVHYKAMSETDTCAAGVKYLDRFGPELGIMRRMPCFLNRKTNKPRYAEALECDKFRPPTPEEIEAY